MRVVFGRVNRKLMACARAIGPFGVILTKREKEFEALASFERVGG